MAKLSQVAVDLETAQSGIWTDFYGIKLKIARANNPAAVAEFRRLAKLARATSRSDQLSDEDAERISLDVMAKCILVDWGEMEDDAGKAIPYTHAKAREILADPKYVDLRAFVNRVSGEMDVYLASAIKGDAGN